MIENVINKNILLGVTGCIAAYKACEIIRSLQNRGCDVRVVATENALEFVGVATFNALTGHETLTNLFDEEGHPIAHIELAKWCDVFLIAPCTANVLAKLANGIADDLLTSTALAAWKKLTIAPAMNSEMYAAPSTHKNLETLLGRGIRIVGPQDGRLACGDTGKGKLEHVNIIVSSVLAIDTPLAGKTVLISAGPTQENIDDVRYISNYSSGKMGFELAKRARDMGAKVIVVSGPVTVSVPGDIDCIDVLSADEMLDACISSFPECDIAIMAAAVCDFRPAKTVCGKLKKEKDIDSLKCIEMTENPDILKTICSIKTDKQFVVGFAAESNDVVDNALTKLNSKGADMIVANDIACGCVFGSDYDKAWIVNRSGVIDLPEMPKYQLAKVIIDYICDNICW